MAKDSIEKSELIMACLGGLILFVFAVAMSIAFTGCGGGGDDSEEPKSSNTAVSNVCVAGNTEVTLPDEAVEALLEEEESSGAEIQTEDAGVGLDNSGALRQLTKVIIIGNCNDVHTEDNDIVSDDDTNFQLGQQQQ